MKLLNWKILIPILVLILFIGGALWKRHLPGSQKTISGNLQVKEIRRDNYEIPGYTPDDIIFSDGSQLNDIGFSASLVGTIPRTDQEPVFLFKSYSCWACEPEVQLLVYLPETQEFRRLEFPVDHRLINTESGKEVIDHVSRAVYGHCDQGQPTLLIASKTQDVDSDGSQFSTPDTWSYSFREVIFDKVIRQVDTNENRFDFLEGLKSETCHFLEPDSSHDYD